MVLKVDDDAREGYNSLSEVLQDSYFVGVGVCGWVVEVKVMVVCAGRKKNTQTQGQISRLRGSTAPTLCLYQSPS